MRSRIFSFVSLLAVCALAAALVGLPSRAAFADPPASSANAAVVGHWQSIDDKTNTPGAIIRTWVDANGKLYGAIEKVLKKDAPADPKCAKCTGWAKDKPLVGLTFMYNLTKDGDDWTGGEIIDPESGTTYHCKVTSQAGGEKLDVRGYVGISALGRTQTWTRVH
jgi:uncharacterized protein (DUF2147 family)